MSVYKCKCVCTSMEPNYGYNNIVVVWDYGTCHIQLSFIIAGRNANIMFAIANKPLIEGHNSSKMDKFIFPYISECSIVPPLFHVAPPPLLEHTHKVLGKETFMPNRDHYLSN